MSQFHNFDLDDKHTGEVFTNGECRWLFIFEGITRIHSKQYPLEKTPTEIEAEGRRWFASRDEEVLVAELVPLELKDRAAAGREIGREIRDGGHDVYYECGDCVIFGTCRAGEWSYQVLDERGAANARSHYAPAVPYTPDMKTDWQGRPVPTDEPADAAILVWEFTSLTGQADYTVERSWQRMLGHVAANVETFLERFDEQQLRDGVNITFWLRGIRKSDLEECYADR